VRAELVLCFYLFSKDERKDDWTIENYEPEPMKISLSPIKRRI